MFLRTWPADFTSVPSAACGCAAKSGRAAAAKARLWRALGSGQTSARIDQAERGSIVRRKVDLSYARRKILKALRAHGIVVEREGSRHTIVTSPDGRKTAVPRHPQINRLTARGIAARFDLDWQSFEREIV
jgi:hypothetical protein